MHPAAPDPDAILHHPGELAMGSASDLPSIQRYGRIPWND